MLKNYTLFLESLQDDIKTQAKKYFAVLGLEENLIEQNILQSKKVQDATTEADKVNLITKNLQWFYQEQFQKPLQEDISLFQIRKIIRDYFCYNFIFCRAYATQSQNIEFNLSKLLQGSKLQKFLLLEKSLDFSKKIDYNTSQYLSSLGILNKGDLQKLVDHKEVLKSVQEETKNTQTVEKTPPAATPTTPVTPTQGQVTTPKVETPQNTAIKEEVPTDLIKLKDTLQKQLELDFLKRILDQVKKLLRQKPIF